MKRFLDLALSLTFILLLFIPIVFLTALIKFKLKSPVFFTQLRPGFNGKPFLMYKFRSMTGECSSDGALLPDAMRLTSFGAKLRSTSLDELPGLWNVLKGDMSLVGPRPLLIEYLPLYDIQQARRHEVKPGITGLAQINGRNAISWEEKFKLDVYYVNNRSLLLDIKILWLTVRKVLLRDGVNATDEVTMIKFTGNKS